MGTKSTYGMKLASEDPTLLAPNEDLSGRKYGDLTVLFFYGRKNGDTFWMTKCKCGSERPVVQHALKKITRSCRKCAGVRSHINDPGRGNPKRPEYPVWQQMKNRCMNKNDKVDYKRYGARGIKVCNRWMDFNLFFKDMGPRPSPNHTLDRIDNDGHYEPGNCRWATATQQNRNRRNNRLITVGHETHCVTEWSEILGIPVMTIRHRLNRGYEPHLVLMKGNLRHILAEGRSRNRKKVFQ